VAFRTLTDEEEKEFLRLSKFYWAEAKRCRSAKAYLAGCVMLGSALETLLTLMINCYPEEAELTGKIPAKNNKPKPLLDWTLAELLRVAKTAGWLPAGLDVNKDDWNNRAAKIGDYAEVARMVRNLLHPAKYREEHFRKRMTRKYLERQFETVSACNDWLLAHISDSILAQLEKEEAEEQG
jgi:hypothetical protein